MSEVNEQVQAEEGPAPGEFNFLHRGEGLNRPHWKRYKLQGKDRVLALVYPNTEYKAGRIIIPDLESTQSIQTTGRVLQLSPSFDHKLCPDVVVGANIKVELATFRMFPCCGDKLAIVDAEHIIAAYDWAGPDTIKRELEEAEVSKQQMEAARQEMLTAQADKPRIEIPSLVIVK